MLCFAILSFCPPFSQLIGSYSSKLAICFILFFPFWRSINHFCCSHLASWDSLIAAYDKFSGYKGWKLSIQGLVFLCSFTVIDRVQNSHRCSLCLPLSPRLAYSSQGFNYEVDLYKDLDSTESSASVPVQQSCDYCHIHLPHIYLLWNCQEGQTDSLLNYLSA